MAAADVGGRALKFSVELANWMKIVAFFAGFGGDGLEILDMGYSAP